MGSIIVKTLKFLVRLLEWEHERLSKAEEKLDAAAKDTELAAQVAIDLHYEKERREAEELRRRRVQATDAIAKSSAESVRRIKARRAVATTKASTDAKVIEALRPLTK